MKNIVALPVLVTSLLALSSVVEASQITWSSGLTYVNTNGRAADTYSQLAKGTVIEAKYTSFEDAAEQSTRTAYDTVNLRNISFGHLKLNQQGGGYGGTVSSTGDATLNHVLSNGYQGGGGQGSVILTLSGLTVGKTYHIQLFARTPYGFWISKSTPPVELQSPNTYYLDTPTHPDFEFHGPNIEPQTGVNYPSWFITGTFTADSTIQLVALYSALRNSSPPPWGNPQIDAYILTGAEPIDTDNDGVNDYREGKDGTDPNDPNSFNALSKGLVGYYPLDGDANDESGYGNSGIVNGAQAALGNSGIVNTALVFDGVDDFVEVPHSEVQRQLPITISVAFKTSQSEPRINSLVSKYYNDSFSGFRLGLSNGKLEPWYLVSRQQTVFFPLLNPVNDGLWRHAVLVVDHEGGKFYLDGSLAQTSQWNGAPDAFTSSSPLYFGLYEPGWNPFGPFYQGVLDNVRLYNRALSPTEVASLFQADSVASANLIVNGSFEAPVITGPWVRFISPSNEIPGWSVTSGEIDISRDDWAAHDGEQSVDLVGLGVMGEVGQIVPTEPGAAYQLSFHYANNPRPYPRPFPATAAVKISEGEGALIEELVITHTGSDFSDMKWPRATVEFVASSSSTRISFAATSEFQDGGICIDSVELTKLLGMPDTDGDGIPDAYETNTGVYVSPTDTGTDPNNPDSDGDTLPDGVETASYIYIDATDTGTDPNLPDTDGDGLSDNVETNTGIYAFATNTGTSPVLEDTSGDGITDGEAVAAQFNPLVDQRPVLNFLTQAVAAQPNRFGFYNEANVMHLGMGGLMIRKSGSVVNLDLQWQTKNSLTNAWTNHGAPLPFFLNLPGSKAFIRLQATPGAP